MRMRKNRGHFSNLSTHLWLKIILTVISVLYKQASPFILIPKWPECRVSRPYSISKSIHFSGRESSRFGSNGLNLKAKEYPQEVIDQEERESPFRPVRYAFLAFCGVGGFASAVVSLAGFVGVQPAKDLAESLNLPNFFLDVAVVVAAFFMWFVEETAKRQHYESIIEEAAYKRRMEKANRPKKSRKQRALAEVASLQESKITSDASEDIASTTVQATDSEKEISAKREDSGLLSSLKATFEEANELGKAQAIMLNSALEEKGVLEPIQKPINQTDQMQFQKDLLQPEEKTKSIADQAQQNNPKRKKKKNNRRKKK